MAKKIDDYTVIVEQGDTLSEIALKYLGDSMSYTQLANINGIKNPNKLYVGQIIKLKAMEPSKPTSGTGSSTTSSTVQSKPTIRAFGLQSNTDNTLYAAWDWSRENTDKYEYEWLYDSGDGVWFIGAKASTEDKQSTYNIPSNAKRVKFRVIAISKKHTVNNRVVSYWYGTWSDYRFYDCDDLPPKIPPIPRIEVNGYQLTAILTDLDVNATEIQFQVAKNNTSIYTTGMATINTNTNYASFSCMISSGDEYKVRCRSCKYGRYSGWSSYSDNESIMPAAPHAITICRATSETSVYLEWDKSKKATTYDIQYATKKEYFDDSDQTTTKTGIEFTRYEISGMETGQGYFFRVRAVNDKGNSFWSPLSYVVLGKKPAAPTTWSSTTTAIVGEQLILYWVHNSSDNSSQTYAELEIYVNGVKEIHTIKNSQSEDEKDKTSTYTIDTTSYSEGTTISWRVRTAGITSTYGDWSVQRVVNIYAPPTLQIEMTDAEGIAIETLTSFPFYVSGLVGLSSQTPIGYHLSIKSNEMYETVDTVGNVKIVNKGDEIYSKHFDITEALLVEFSANNVDLENNISYTVTCIVSMNSGLTAESSLDFDVKWDDERYDPNAEITVDKDTLVAYICPYCEDIKWTYYKVAHDVNEYVVTTEVLEEMIGIPVEEIPTVSVYTTDGYQVFSGTTSGGEDVYFCVIPSRYLVEGVELSVYRREFDGTFTEVATNIANNRNTFVTDPHPALDFARYRIIATMLSTGTVSYSDIAGYPVGEKSVIIQWDEDWTQFETSNEDEMEKPPWSGSLLKLPYNIDVSDKHSKDASLVEYTGRKHPVSYYGTQLGSASSWSVEIPKSDKETIYAIRRLAIWTGDVYVREPSGTGYWASISVSYDINHKATTVPVSFDITRVEGGL